MIISAGSFSGKLVLITFALKKYNYEKVICLNGYLSHYHFLYP